MLVVCGKLCDRRGVRGVGRRGGASCDVVSWGMGRGGEGWRCAGVEGWGGGGGEGWRLGGVIIILSIKVSTKCPQCYIIIIIILYKEVKDS